MLAEIGTVLWRDMLQNQRTVGSTARSGQEKEVVYALNKHLCTKCLLGASRVQALGELLFWAVRERLNNQ